MCLSELRRCPPSTLEELQNTLTAQTDSLDREEIIHAARDISVRAKVCKQAQGGPFKFMLKKYKRNVNREE